MHRAHFLYISTHRPRTPRTPVAIGIDYYDVIWYDGFMTYVFVFPVNVHFFIIKKGGF
jgi:hypothetical protein